MDKANVLSRREIKLTFSFYVQKLLKLNMGKLSMTDQVKCNDEVKIFLYVRSQDSNLLRRIEEKLRSWDLQTERRAN